MKSCVISLALISICSAQGQSSYAGSWTSSGPGGSGGQSQRGYGLYQGSQGPGAVSVHTINGSPYSSSSTSAVTATSGSNKNGEKYNRHTVENVQGNTLYHSESIEWPSRKTVNEFRYKLDLSNPRSTSVWDYGTAPNDNRVYRRGDAATSSAGRYWYDSAERYWCYVPFLLLHFVKF